LSYRQVQGAAADETSVTLEVLQVDPRQWNLRVIDARDFGKEVATAADLARWTGALAVINGGFFDENYRPLGLMIVDGTRKNPLRKADWGVFLLRRGVPEIIHTRHYRRDPAITQALQVGPRLVVNGCPTSLKPQSSRRSAVGLTRDGKVLLAACDSSFDFPTFAQLLCRPENDGGLACVSALNLDGGPSTQLYARFNRVHIEVPGGWGVPNGLGVFRRDE
jgi:uncharacterized protein YigE (DUF2233 family)